MGDLNAFSKWEMSGLMTYFVWNLVQCLFRGDLLQGRPSTNQFYDKLPWFLKATPTADCTKGGYGAYLNSLDLNGTSLQFRFPNWT